MKVSIIQIPYDSGHFNKRMGCGPLRLIMSGLTDWLSSAGHDVHSRNVHFEKEFLFEAEAAVHIQGEVKKMVETDRRNGFLPLVLAGNCNYAAFGTMAALQPVKTGVLWFDAHGDFNTAETSSSGFFDGMALSILTGNSWSAFRQSMENFTAVPEQQVLLIGVHDLDTEEKNLLERSAIQRITAAELRSLSVERINRLFFTSLRQNVKQLYLHIDLDVLDETILKANQFATSGGLELNDLLKIISLAGKTFEIAAIGLTAYDPSFDLKQRAGHIVQETLGVLI